MTAIDRQAPKGATTDEGRLDLLRRIAAAGGTIHANGQDDAVRTGFQRNLAETALGVPQERHDRGRVAPVRP